MPESGGASRGWEAVAEAFIDEGRRSTVGVARVAAWVESLPAGAAILDLGCGPGGPRSRALSRAGCRLFAIDASPSLAAAYQSSFPAARVACEPVAESTFFGRTFDGALAWGLLFLLPAGEQRNLVRRVARALRPGGGLLFTAPSRACRWPDLTTGQPSLSLGAQAYEASLRAAGLTLVAEYEDEGENHYYEARSGPRRPTQ